MDGMITLILLLLGSLAISTLVIGGYSVILYLLIQKIPGDRTRLFFPILVAAILIAIYPS